MIVVTKSKSMPVRASELARMLTPLQRVWVADPRVRVDSATDGTVVLAESQRHRADQAWQLHPNNPVVREIERTPGLREEIDRTLAAGEAS